jgi:transcriptional regulator
MLQGQTIRQELMQLLASTRRSARELAELLAVSEREVEDHLAHVVRSLAHDRDRCFVLEPSSCRECGFLFKGRTRLKRPSRCPRCRSEAISAPRYGIDLRG